MRRAIIISSQALFREGLRHLLSEMPNMEVAGVVTTVAEAMQLSVSKKPDVIVVSQEQDDHNLIADILALTNAKLVSISLENSGMTIYHRKHLPEASVDELIEVLKSD